MDRDKKFWNKVAKFYTGFMNKNEDMYQTLSDFVSPYLRSDMDVLELGCGTGQLSFLLYDKVAEYTATDFSDEMVRIGNGRVRSDELIFKVEDIMNLSFRDDSFDAVICANVLHIVPDMDRALSEIKRVLKPNGTAFLPIFVYDDVSFSLPIWLMEKIGFRTYYKYTSEQYMKHLISRGFEIVDKKIITAKPVSQFAVIVQC